MPLDADGLAVCCGVQQTVPVRENRHVILAKRRTIALFVAAYRISAY